jgi:hypothetical protein
MNRRRFLKWVGAGTAAVAVAPTALFHEGPACVAAVPTTIGDYADYANFSELARAQAIDEMVSNTAAELGRQAALTYNERVAAYDLPRDDFKFFQKTV